MMTELQRVVAKVQELTDIALATLLCLIANEHCIIQTEEDSLDALQDELQLVASNVFRLSTAVVQCSPSTTLEDLTNGILILKQPIERDSLPKNHSPNRRNSSFGFDHSGLTEDRTLASIIIARDLNLASHQIQIQVLELLRTNRIFTHTAVYTAPKPFLIVALNAEGGPPLVKHLNDHLFISHFHNPNDGFANLEEGSEWVEDDRESLSSVVHKSVNLGNNREPLFTPEDIHLLTEATKTVSISAEVSRYLHNILTFLRLHRAVAPGCISPLATGHFKLLVKCLAPLHFLTFVTPSLISLAAPKIYRHRIVIVAAENERSMQYGSELAAVKALLDGLTPEQIVDEVVCMVEAPL